MAKKKSDSFFLRIGARHGTGNGFTEVSEDLGAYVDALGKSVLRIHNVQVAFQVEGEPGIGPIASATGGELNVYWQLTTQSQSAAVMMTDKSVVSCGRLYTGKDSGGQVIIIDHEANQNPMDFTQGYLIATGS